MSINAHLPTCPFVAAVATVTSGAAAISLIIVDGAAVPHAFADHTLARQNISSLTRSKAIDVVVICKDLLPPPLKTGASRQWSLAAHQAGQRIARIFHHGQSRNHPSLDARETRDHWYAAERILFRQSSYADPLALNGAWPRHGKRDMHPIITSWRKPVP
jgi:hypothetical protein